MLLSFLSSIFFVCANFARIIFNVKLDEVSFLCYTVLFLTRDTCSMQKKPIHWNCDIVKISGLFFACLFVFSKFSFVQWLLCTVSAHLAASAAAASITHISLSLSLQSFIYIFHFYYRINYNLSLHFVHCIQLGSTVSNEMKLGLLLFYRYAIILWFKSLIKLLIINSTNKLIFTIGQ